MSTARTLAAVQRTKQYQSLIAAGLQLASTERQLDNGTLVLTGKVRVGRKNVGVKYAVTATGAVISNEYTARRVTGATPTAQYREGLEAVAEILSKRVG
jgi:hypothetical protein